MQFIIHTQNTCFWHHGCKISRLIAFCMLYCQERYTRFYFMLVYHIKNSSWFHMSIYPLLSTVTSTALCYKRDMCAQFQIYSYIYGFDYIILHRSALVSIADMLLWSKKKQIHRYAFRVKFQVVQASLDWFTLHRQYMVWFVKRSPKTLWTLIPRRLFQTTCSMQRNELHMHLLQTEN